MNTNLLDLDNDILNIIGDFAKKDNACRIEKEIQNYICLEDQFDYCFRKNITI